MKGKSGSLEMAECDTIFVCLFVCLYLPCSQKDLRWFSSSPFMLEWLEMRLKDGQEAYQEL